IKLVNRERQRLVITDAGRPGWASAKRASRYSSDLAARSGDVLTVRSPEFWRVAAAIRSSASRTTLRCSRIDLRVSATMHHIDFVREEVDVAVRHGDGNWSGLDAVRLCTEQLFPVCSPKLMAGRNRLTKPSDLVKTPLLHLDDSKAWSQCFDTAGVADGETSA